jgi:hypothetical protein
MINLIRTKYYISHNKKCQNLTEGFSIIKGYFYHILFNFLLFLPKNKNKITISTYPLTKYDKISSKIM